MGKTKSHRWYKRPAVLVILIGLFILYVVGRLCRVIPVGAHEYWRKELYGFFQGFVGVLLRGRHDL